jgi:hypothetical protein
MNKRLLYTLGAFSIAIITAIIMLVFVFLPHEKEGVQSFAVLEEGIETSNPSQGIDVHGHWIIQVLNPDGGLVSKHEFDNALISRITLAKVLSRENTIGNWSVLVSDPHGDSLARDRRPCVICEPSDPQRESYYYFPNLTVTREATATGHDKLVLSGRMTAEIDSSVGEVFTKLSTCDATVSPVDCPGSTSVSREGDFTGYYVPIGSEIPVTAGQEVLVTVEITFD